MSLRAGLVRASRRIAVAMLTLVVLAFVFVQAQQWLLRYRARHLLADFQAIRLHQSTWADAQTLMTRWGAWGHYEGRCTSSGCDYIVKLSDVMTTKSPRCGLCRR